MTDKRFTTTQPLNVLIDVLQMQIGVKFSPIQWGIISPCCTVSTVIMLQSFQSRTQTLSNQNEDLDFRTGGSLRMISMRVWHMHGHIQAQDLSANAHKS